MAYQTSSIRSDVSSISLTILSNIKSYFQLDDQNALTAIRNTAPTLAAELEQLRDGSEGVCLIPLVNVGICVIQLSDQDYNHPKQVHARRSQPQPDPRNQRPQSDRLRDAQGQSLPEKSYVPFGSGARYIGKLSVRAGDELIRALNEGITKFRTEKRNERMMMSSADAIIFDDPRKTQYNDIIAAQRFMCVAAIARELTNPNEKVNVSALKMYLATTEMSLTQFVMIDRLHKMIEDVHADTTASQRVSCQALMASSADYPDQFLGLSNRDALIITHLRQPGCIADVRVKLSGGILLTKTNRGGSSASNTAAVRERIAKAKNERKYDDTADLITPVDGNNSDLEIGK
ncbi:RNA binding protein NSP38 [Antheraea assamensis cypovirus 4]|uniref:RNA binding protein NSP38 n=1 Tax=Antheraea assamensis cypovirus 4 TaxID=180166 RepID=A0AAE9N6S7_9REOV|nr:RNA binding protein NSP38 [Antheraea assamensis cypovirus 4]WPN08789.1 RNA binding protein NSP [Cypovirus 4]